MSVDAVLRGLSHDPAAAAVIDRDGVHSYTVLGERIEAWRRRIAAAGIPPHAVVSVEADYSLDCVAAILALAQHPATFVPLSRDSERHRDEFLETAEVEWRVHPHANSVEPTGRTHRHAYFTTLEQRRTPGLVLFTSGSTGRSKAAVHDFGKLCAKFAVPKRRLRTLVFLQPDHIGGINTLLYTLSNAGTIVLPEGRSPGLVCDLVARHRVELLPTSPTFLRMLLLAFDPDRHDLSSLALITYGTEPMPESTLRSVRELLPHVRLQQTYGLTEVGILRSQSREDGSLWVRVGGEGFDVKIQEGRLWVKAASAMLGYLNAPSPFSSDGYLDTGDSVEVDGDWVRILGRTSEIINVGGSKVYPAEVEDVVLQMPEVDDVVVTGEGNPLVGQIVVAHVKLQEPMPLGEFKARLRQFCGARLPAFKVPSRIVLSEQRLYGARFKKQRTGLTV